MQESSTAEDGFETALSLERFARYLAWAGSDRDAAIRLYCYNTRLSESLYTPMQMLEVALRNRVHAVMCARAGEHWYADTTGILRDAHQLRQVADAIRALAGAGKDITPGRIVASLTLSFWTTMFNNRYETLWRESLHRIACPMAPGNLRRKDFSGALTPIRLLRNRIAHHEPILAWNLRRHHAKIIEVIGWLSPPAKAWCRENDRFPHVQSRCVYSLEWETR